MIVGWKEKINTRKANCMVLNTFGKRLRALRQERGLSQIDLRDRMEKEYGVSIGGAYVSELERSDRTPPLATAAAMAKVLNVSLDYLGLLIEDGELSYKREEESINYISPEADQVAQLMDSMSVTQRDMLVLMARNLAVLDNERQRNKAAAKNVLDSIERNMGKTARDQAERIMRGQGLLTDAGAGSNEGGV